MEIKWHAQDANAAARFPGSNAGSGWTAQIKIGNKLLGQDEVLYRKPSNVTHMPVDILNMKSFAYYSSLPDLMTIDEVELEFEEILDGLESQRVNSVCFIKSLMELSERQWHTYSVLSFCVRKRVGDYLLSVWDGNDLEMVENVIGIMVRLGLERINVFLRSIEEKDVSPEVFNEILLAISELGDSVSDPYSGMR